MRRVMRLSVGHGFLAPVAQRTHPQRGPEWIRDRWRTAMSILGEPDHVNAAGLSSKSLYGNGHGRGSPYCVSTQGRVFRTVCAPGPRCRLGRVSAGLTCPASRPGGEPGRRLRGAPQLRLRVAELPGEQRPSSEALEDEAPELARVVVRATVDRVRELREPGSERGLAGAVEGASAPCLNVGEQRMNQREQLARAVGAPSRDPHAVRPDLGHLRVAGTSIGADRCTVRTQVFEEAKEIIRSRGPDDRHPCVISAQHRRTEGRLSYLNRRDLHRPHHEATPRVPQVSPPYRFLEFPSVYASSTSTTR